MVFGKKRNPGKNESGADFPAADRTNNPVYQEGRAGQRGAPDDMAGTIVWEARP